MATASVQNTVENKQEDICSHEPLGGPFRELRLTSQIKELRQGPGWLAGRNSRTLVKHRDVRIVLTALKARGYVHEHHAAGSITVQALEGHILMHIPGHTFEASPGWLIVLEQAVPHEVEAVTDSAYLVIIACCEPFAMLAEIVPAPGSSWHGSLHHAPLRAETSTTE
jgi:quercetin dioxygenase-like cupin family protein